MILRWAAINDPNVTLATLELCLKSPMLHGYDSQIYSWMMPVAVCVNSASSPITQCRYLAPDVFVAKALSRISLSRHNGAMRLQFKRNIWEPTELVRFLITANIVLYVTALFFAPGAENYDLSPMVFLSPGTGVLFKLGASVRSPSLQKIAGGH
jgi:hypothetical protein